MQTRTLAAASSLLLALGLVPLALRLAAAQPGTVVPPGTGGGMHTPVATSLLDVSAPEQAGETGQTTASAVLDGEARAALAPTTGDAAARTEALASILAGWAATDAGASLVWLDQHGGLDQPRLMQAIGEGLAADPTAVTFALTFLAQDHTHGAQLTAALIQSLAAQGDAAAAAQLALARPEGWAAEWSEIGFAALAYEDAATALEALAAVTDPEQRQATAAAIIEGWADRDPAELAQHADVFDLPAERAAAREVALLVWQQRDPSAAAAYAAALAPRG